MSEESIFIVDIGSSSIKAGYTGEDIPSYVFPSTISKYSQQKNIEGIEAIPNESNDDGIITSYQSNFVNDNQYTHPIYRGAVTDWDDMENLWKSIAETVGLTSKHADGTFNWNTAESTSIFLIESHKSTHADRSKWAELLFESYHAPSICFMNSAALSIFASGRTTGLAVECGAGYTSSVPVFEGFPLKHAIVSMDYGGQDVSYQFKKSFQEKNIMIDMASAKTIKEKMAFATGYYSPDSPHTSSTSTTFCLPDGHDVTVDSKIFSSCTEALFYNNNVDSGGLISQIYDSITLCDESIRKDLTTSIILSGGTSMLAGLGDRLDRELVRKFAGDTYGSNILVVPNSKYREKGYTTQRKFAPWIGGSLMSSFDTYHKTLKIARQEWEENPDIILKTKCF